ncbi:MAG: UDP-N-acetylmuramoylalanine--D-glutamate ligase [Candidatus Omnitrophica bacterium CG1_02_44_16]|nr:MAG: UDP-N-acetylmuramoylalanine--D-glutamate ligase [Candidatus Omnitrophica bacterium CG1_02_44_16]PIY83659.1 MAG: UDP-N-acetylmuramoyl-L-alanine--D-glutamate ligase [Candidatus Omnitrophica bacterium CG_4_10_14_0_8_um_filter_44_12]PIZ84443.1 MAG: UDP-N-acetylmuramoyl-L-alanine--D-glutamate ligase [Candidatus Omnitrophica bacterium CG_4_10_14_0_2_um_filter_44_9]
MKSYKNLKITVVGLARSGMAAARLLKRSGASVSITEKKNTPALEKLSTQLKTEGIGVELGAHSRSFIEGRDLIVISPGVRLDADPVKWAKGSNIEVISEIELSFSLCPAPVIAITGTNGKTTTTTLVGEVIKACGKKVFVLGNIGTPFSSAVLSMRGDDLVSLEVSSFQLEAIKDFKPKIAVILNLTPDHLDRYRDVDEYLEAKKRIYMNQEKDDILILNYGDNALRKIAEEAKPKVEFFNKEEWEKDLDQNQMAVLAVAEALGIKRSVCAQVFKKFKGVEHRMEFVRDIGGIEFINDSKATNIDSTIWALTNIRKPAVLIAGGRDKGSDFASIRALVKDKVREAVLVGEASERIAAAWDGVVPIYRVETFHEAVTAAYKRARPGEMVLFSPMCKSFDMFTDYEHRGRVFKELVNKFT